ncbi:PLC-like phosphodiesterase [Mytilinidion resinicola]|uniref:PLC-like phosphodiesterase n=1 Tax=Mytilinidion resinicola TaxID=574789 RepID=A0A6A6Z2L4_9PEZI|nr:PLC-like phosphodiesterase [Mytilinidion resinicola]KAF2814969.1 PLC-like phosphodiesterase [Mytilinidion resinicola]
MGWGGYMTLVNGSPFDWTVTGSHSYQMSTWNWPTISAGKSSKVYVEYAIKGSTGDDAGEAYYKLAGTSNTFQIQAKKLSDYHLYVTLDGMSTKTNPQGSVIDQGFRHNSAVNWIMSTDESGAIWSNGAPPIDWMQQSLGSIGNRTLRHICMPGSHDAGMSSYSPGTVGANFENTQAQYLDMYNQLLYGSRFFDLRPVISDGNFVSGHYSEVESVWVGGNGQSLADIISAVNKFTAQYHEMIIINLSHTLNTDSNYADLTQAEWNRLWDQLKGINNLVLDPNPGNTDYTTKVLNDFIGNSPSVFVINQLPNGISLGNYATQGFFSSANFPMFDSYSDSNSAATMEADQLQKVKDNRNIVADDGARKDTFHLLSWTLTQQAEDVLNFDKAIMNLAVSVYDDLFDKAYNAFTPESFPNVLYMDAYAIRDKCVVLPYDKPATVSAYPDVYALAMAVNNGIAGRNPYITGGGS